MPRGEKRNIRGKPSLELSRVLPGPRLSETEHSIENERTNTSESFNVSLLTYALEDHSVEPNLEEYLKLKSDSTKSALHETNLRSYIRKYGSLSH